jgi:hypothetical protein
MYQDDQAFLNAAMQEASGNETTAKLILLQYELALLETLQHFQPCDEYCAHVDFTLLRKRVEKLHSAIRNAIALVTVVPGAHVQDLFKESRRLLPDAAQLCPSCLQRIRRSIPAAFRSIYTAD